MADRRGEEMPRGSSTESRPVAEPPREKRQLSERMGAAFSGGGSTAGTASVARAAGGGRSPGSTSSRPSTTRPRGTRRARLRLVHLDPWSVMKTSFLLSVAFGVVTVVAVLMVWSVLGAAGVWDSINQTVQDVVGGQDSASTFDVQDYLGTSRIIGFTMLVAVIDVVLLTAIATLGAFLYNMAAALLGGIEVTLAEDER
jgi:hypothetical protein